MTDYPIIFSAPMIRALLDGRKTMTRRLAWSPARPSLTTANRTVERLAVLRPSPWQKVKPGDRLWVREGWRAVSPDDPDEALYMADKHDNLPPGFKWRPSIHMPRTASRLTLIVTAVKIERLQDISEADARAEGVAAWAESDPVAKAWPPVKAFIELWETLHGEDAWAENSEVVPLTFTVRQINIDKIGTGESR